ncbi:MAG TPA: putative sulfate exporter family transporter [Methylomirabilota bacterium]|nr:putative sulfate exporter family transporter [Methylomirabilota bacterium]
MAENKTRSSSLTDETKTEAKTRSSVLSEDWLAVWLSFLIILLVLVGVRPDMPKYRWATDAGYASAVSEQKPAIDKLAADARAKGDAELAAAADTLKGAVEKGDRATIGAAAKKVGDAAKNAQDPGLKRLGADVGKLSGDAGAYVGGVFSAKNLWASVKIGIAFWVLSAIGIALMGGSVGKYVVGFPIVFVFAWLSQVMAGNSTVNYWGLEYVIFALAIGLLVSNIIGIPGWLQEAVRTEYYIKTGLVILGAGILFFEIVQAGALGIIQAVLVVAVVWYICWWISRALRVDEEFAVMLSTAVSICGVSAAIAACGAIQGDKKKLSYVTSLVLIVAVPMMVLMPMIAKALQFPEVVAGAWLGGTLDTSGSVVAAGALISETAMKAGVIVKFSQNVLIGVAAFMLAIWWAYKKGAEKGELPSARVIWERFPKFVLGFIVASFVFSFALDLATVNATKGMLAGLRTMWLALAFVSIGLETRFTQLVSMEGGRPAVAFLGAQAINVLWTLLLAYLLFGGVIFPVPQIK